MDKVESGVTVLRKRKALQLTSQSIKRTCVEAPAQSDDEDEDAPYESSNDSHPHDSDGSSHDVDDDRSTSFPTGTNTPSTPFSPAHVKRPSQLKPLKCLFEGCEKTFNRPVRLEAHQRSHTNERPFVCAYEGCDKAYMQEKHLKSHVKGSHLHERTYACEWPGCSKTFLTGQRLRRHQNVHDGEERFRCTGFLSCTQTFRKHQTMQRHIRFAHMGLPRFPCTFVDPETSMPCSAAFEAAGSLRKHMNRFHSDPRFTCEECSGELDDDGQNLKLTFPTKSQLTAHVRDQHAARCIFCDLICSRQQTLQHHIESQHSATTLEDRKRIACTYPGCDKRFVKNSNLNAHVLSVHQGKRFECGKVDLQDTTGAGSWDGHDACGLSFSSKPNLVDHVRTQHMGLPSILNANRIKGPTKAASMAQAAKKYSAIDELTGNVYAAFQGRDISCAFPDCPFQFMRAYDHQVHLMSKHGLTEEQASELCTGQVVLDPKYLAHSMDITNGAPALNSPEVEPHQEGFETNSAQEPVFPDFFPLSSDPASQIRSVGENLPGSPGIYFPHMQEQTIRDSPFWIGAEDDQGPPGDDTWLLDEREMHRLIERNDGLAGDCHSFWDSLDPELRGP